jgi:hypothetical protein
MPLHPIVQDPTLIYGLNTIHPLKVVTHFQFGYQRLKFCNVPSQSYQNCQYCHFVCLFVKLDGILNACVSHDFFFFFLCKCFCFTFTSKRRRFAF